MTIRLVQREAAYHAASDVVRMTGDLAHRRDVALADGKDEGRVARESIEASPGTYQL